MLIIPPEIKERIVKWATEQCGKGLDNVITRYAKVLYENTGVKLKVVYKFEVQIPGYVIENIYNSGDYETKKPDDNGENGKSEYRLDDIEIKRPFKN